VFEKVRVARDLVHLARERLPHYGPLLRQDLHRFRDEIVKATLGAGMALGAGLIFCCFFSIAVIVSAWDGPHRELAAWLVCAAWGVLALAGLWIARRAVDGPTPFRLVSGALSRDYVTFIDAIDAVKEPERPR
jgi:hypothetical protein